MAYCLILIVNYCAIITPKKGVIILMLFSFVLKYKYMLNFHHRFELHYYTCAGCYLSMTVDNRTQEDPNNMILLTSTQVASSSGSNNTSSATRDDIVAPPLERLIHTKWAEAKITFKGPPPASLSY